MDDQEEIGLSLPIADVLVQKEGCGSETLTQKIV